MSVSNGLRSLKRPRIQDVAFTDPLVSAGYSVGSLSETAETAAQKLSAVDRCIEILSDSIAKLPNYIIDSRTRDRITNHPLHHVLNIRPNEAMTPFVRKKVLETSRLEGGNGYDWIIRNPRTGAIDELIPVPWRLVQPWRDMRGRVWYTVTHPVTGEPMVLPQEDIAHYKGSSRDGLTGTSVLRRAGEVIAAGRAAQEYDRAYYENGGQPAGVLRTESDLRGYVKDQDGNTLLDSAGKPVTRKDHLRSEWERIHSGPKKSHRIAILDFGLDYKPLATSNRDAQFVENKEVFVRDIARFFGVPLYKLNEGKQAYGSNEQNSIEYVVSTLHPIVTQYEEEQTWKFLIDSELAKGLEVRINLMAELKGDTASRANWYRTMSEVSVFSPNDIAELEDLPDVPGGEHRRASLNYVPLVHWEDLSLQRNGGSNK